MTAATPRPKRVPIRIEVRAVSWLSPSMVRVVFGGDDLARFDPSPYADSYVKLVFMAAGTPPADSVDLDALREELSPEHWPRLRTYTVRAFDPTLRQLTIDFVVHGDEGLAGPWAARAAVGDVLYLLGPGGAYAPDPAADWHLLVGDESALPAIAVALERLPADAVAHVLLEVDGPADQQDLGAPHGAAVVWLHRAGRPLGAALVDAVGTLRLPPGRGSAFVHGEADAVKELRRILRIERGLGREQLSISGYWRRGAEDEAWRAQKREWNAAIEDAVLVAGAA